MDKMNDDYKKNECDIIKNNEYEKLWIKILIIWILRKNL